MKEQRVKLPFAFGPSIKVSTVKNPKSTSYSKLNKARQPSSSSQSTKTKDRVSEQLKHSALKSTSKSVSVLSRNLAMNIADSTIKKVTQNPAISISPVKNNTYSPQKEQKNKNNKKISMDGSDEDVIYID